MFSFRRPPNPINHHNSPYSQNYKPNLTHDERELIAHRQHVSKLHRAELEDRYLSMLEELFSVKKENILNHDKIRRLITKIIRLTTVGGGDSKIRINSASTKQTLSIDEDMQIRYLSLSNLS